MRTVVRVITRILASLAVLSLSSVVFTGCGASPSSTYTGTDGSYVRLPGTWTLFDGDTILRVTDPEASVVEGVYLAGFAFGTDDPSAVLRGGDKPAGLLLSTDIPEGAEIDADRSIIVSNLNEMLSMGAASFVEDYSSFETVDGLVGERSVIDMMDYNGDRMRLLQQMVTDDERTHIWVLAVGCSVTCFEKKEEVIRDIAQNWKVDPKR